MLISKIIFKKYKIIILMFFLNKKHFKKQTLNYFFNVI
jgi:hypothetical protein